MGQFVFGLSVFLGFRRLYARLRWIGKSGKSVTKFP